MEIVGAPGTTMQANEFVDYYEVLELSPKAKFETVERVFRYLAKMHHPDFADNLQLEKHRFAAMIEAFETLRDPELRAAYDIRWDAHQSENHEVVRGANAAENDCEDRARILSIFYGQRRHDLSNPGVSIGRIEDLTGCPAEVLAFHLWYFRERGWISREESGLMSITALGVDQIESRYYDNEEGLLRIEDKAHDRGELVPST